MSKKLEKEMRKAVARSGYLMEQRIAAYLKSRAYYVIPNYGFKDPETGDAREIDIWAYGAERVAIRRREFVFPMLLIEAKNLQAPLVFFTHSEIPISAMMGEVHLSGLPTEVILGRSREELNEFLSFESFHHYYKKARLSSQFCAVYRDSKKQWVAGHDLGGFGSLYQKAILPLVKAIEHEKKEFEGSWEYDPGNEIINLQFHYPILVTGGEIYECFLGGSRPRYKRVHRINFIRRYHSEQIKGEYRIDVVSELGFRKLIPAIENEVSQIARRIRRKQIILRRSANQIARERMRQKRKRTPRVS